MRKRSNTHIHCRVPSAGNYCVRAFMNEVSKVERFLFSKKQFLVRDDKDLIMQGFAQFRKMSGLVWSHCGYKSWLEQTRPNIFPNPQKPARLHIKIRYFTPVFVNFTSTKDKNEKRISSFSTQLTHGTLLRFLTSSSIE